MIVTANRKTLLENNKHLLEEAQNTNNPKKRYDALLCYRTVLEVSNSNSLFKNRFSIFGDLVDFMGAYINNSVAWDKINDFYLNKGENLIEDNDIILKNLLKSYKKKDLFGPKLEELEMLSRVEKFYSSFDEKLRSIYKEIINYDKNILFLTKQIGGMSNELKCNGVSVSSDIIEQKSVFVANYNNLVTYISLVHEFGHLIACHNNNSFNGKYDICSEVESLFPELVAIYELMKNDQSVASCYLMVNSLDSNLYGIDEIYKLSKVLNMWQENSFQIDGNYFKSLKDEDISKRYFKKLLEFDFYENITYINSIIIALKLLFLYTKDREEAIHLYKGIVMNNGHDRKKSLRIVNKVDAAEEMQELHNNTMHILTLEANKKGH